MYIAIGLTLFVVLVQFIFFVKSMNECDKLSKLFPSKLNDQGKSLLIIKDSIINRESKQLVDDNSPKILNSADLKVIKLIALESSEKNISPHFRGILSSTNSYLKNNIDTTAEFNILRDIADRVSDSEENKIASTISLPLYIGLMGTFVGVIYGIFNIVIFKGEIGSSIISDDSIQAFLGGVFIAMFGSLIGLLLTTFNNSFFFKRAKSIRDALKNSYLNFLQTELLPTLENTLGKNLREFKDNLSSFNEEFSGNILDFKGTIPAITDNLKLQTEFIKKFREIDIERVANVNLKIFDKLTESAEIFKSFNKYASSINKSVLKSDEMLIKLTDLLNRLSDFENNIKSIGVLVRNSDENYAQIGEYIVEKLSALKNRYQLIQEFVDKSEDEVKNISNESIDRIKALSQNLEQQFDNVFNFTTVDNPFSKLELLESVNKTLMIISEKLNQPKPTLPAKDDNHNLTVVITQLSHSINALKKSIRPSIFKPGQFFKFIFSRDGN